MNERSALPAYDPSTLAEKSAQELVDLLIRDEDRAPRNLIEECARRGSETIALLRGVYDKEYDIDDEPDRWWLRLHAAHILGLMATEQAGLLIVEHMRRMAAAGDENLQDWLAGHWPVLFLNKPATVLLALRALAGDQSFEWYIRYEAMAAVVARARGIGADALEEALAWTASFAMNEDEDNDLRMFCGNILLDYPRPRYRQLLDDLARQQKKPFISFALEDVEDAYAKRGDHPGWDRHHKNPWQFYEPATIEARQQRWAEEDATEREREKSWMKEGEELDEFPLPYVRAEPKVGRNDPCPCGSGKKYKKCCLNK